MAKQRLEPPASGKHIGVQEGDEVGGTHSQAGVARCGGSLAAGMAQHRDVAVHAREVRLLDRGRRAVVNHHDTHAAQRRDQSMYSRSVVTDRNNNCDVAM